MNASPSPHQRQSPEPTSDFSDYLPVSSMSGQTNCVQCGMEIGAEQYSAHFEQCLAQKEMVPDDSNIGQCPLCNQMVENLLQHCQMCMTDNDTDDGGNYELSEATSVPQIDSQTGHTSNRKPTRDCIWCFKSIAEDDYIAHVQSCLPQSPDDINSRTTDTRIRDSCLNCASAVSQADGSAFVISCPSRHVYCLRCIRNSMNEFLESRLIPVCHSMFCDYQLSRHDLSLIPLEEHNFRRLLTLVQNNQRPQCPRCHFYIDVDIIADFNQHIDSCDLENGIPCDYCHCPYEMSQLDEHARQCRNDPMYRQQKLVDFILPRTKYPFTPQQIDFFIEIQKKNHRPIDALSLVEALAEFESVFPLELPTRECDVCMESCLYDDIYVFGCPDSHKLCYKCYEISCKTKMNNNEILTCGICSYQLPYGELQQLRVLPAQRDQFVQYQVQKTFESYAGSGRGIIKCPNQNCQWAFEPENPMERFRVICQLCNNQFCSLCNQQYHYRTHCQQLAAITQQWFFWCNTERGRYLQTKAKEDAAYLARLKEYERQQIKNRSQNASLRRRYNELMADEKYKEKNCRICPHCGRIVQHMGGCASMVCGRDYHGGNDQSGCGQNFTWEQTKPYVAAPDRKPEEVMRDLFNPKNTLVIHENVKCDGCHDTVRGIRFDCIHCPALTYCEKCEQKLTLLHSNENNQEGKPQHVFQLIMIPNTN